MQRLSAVEQRIRLESDPRGLNWTGCVQKMIFTCAAGKSFREKCPVAFLRCCPRGQESNCHTAARTLQEHLEKCIKRLNDFLRDYIIIAVFILF